MVIEDKNIVGIKLSLPPRLCEDDEDYGEFLESLTASITEEPESEVSYLMECKYYDDESGTAYMHFVEPMEDNDLIYSLFEEEDIIYELDK